MNDIVELYEDERGNVALVHGDHAYTTNRFELGESFLRDAQNIVEGHFSALVTESRHSLNLTRNHRVASYNGGVIGLYVDPSDELRDYLGIHYDE